MSFHQFCNPHAELAGITVRNHDAEDDQVSILLIPCFQTKEAEFFALLKDPNTGSWREFAPNFRESKEAFVKRIDRTMRAERTRRKRKTAA